MPKNFSWLYPLSKPLEMEVARDAMLNDSYLWLFDLVLIEGIFPMDQVGCDAGVWVFIKAWGMHLC